MKTAQPKRSCRFPQRRPRCSLNLINFSEPPGMTRKYRESFWEKMLLLVSKVVRPSTGAEPWQEANGTPSIDPCSSFLTACQGFHLPLSLWRVQSGTGEWHVWILQTGQSRSGRGRKDRFANTALGVTTGKQRRDRWALNVRSVFHDHLSKRDSVKMKLRFSCYGRRIGFTGTARCFK